MTFRAPECIEAMLHVIAERCTHYYRKHYYVIYVMSIDTFTILTVKMIVQLSIVYNVCVPAFNASNHINKA